MKIFLLALILFLTGSALAQTDLPDKGSLSDIKGKTRVYISGDAINASYLTGELRHLNISPAMEKILLERMEKTDGEFLFTRSGKVTGKMYDALKAACKANGLVYGGRDTYGITFGRSRHTGITNMIRSGVDIQTVGTIVGHSNSTMTMHYAHGDPEAIKKAILELDRTFEGA
jgi:integrase